MKTPRQHYQSRVRMNLLFALVFWGLAGWALGRGDYWWALVDVAVFLLNMGSAGYNQAKADNARDEMRGNV